MATPGPCPKCGGRMDEGALLVKDSNGGRGATQWLEGAIERTFFRGIKISGRKLLPIKSWRCNRCGLLETYALES
jgi:hypothetical protein